MTVKEAMKTSQFWLIYIMSILSIFQGYYAINVYKAYGYSKPALNDDSFLTQVGSLAAFMGTMRFVWSASMDFKYGTFRLVYGTLLIIQIALGASMPFAAQ